MSSQLVPVNQANALPLISVQQAATAGTLQVIGSALYRVFSPTDLGINASAVTSIVGPPAFVYLATNWLDLRGCGRNAFRLRRVTPLGAGPALSATCGLFVQYRLGPADTPGVQYVNGGVTSNNYNAMFQVSGLNNATFPATTGAGEAQTVAWAWADNYGSGIAWSTSLALGGNARFIVSWGASASDFSSSVFTAFHEAQS